MSSLGLTITNGYQKAGVSLAIAWNCSSCLNKGNFTKAGWIYIGPLQSKQVLNGNLGAVSRYIAYFGVTDDGHKWDNNTGNPAITGVRFQNNVAEQFGPECWNEPEPFQANFMVIDTYTNNQPNASGTLLLKPAAGW